MSPPAGPAHRQGRLDSPVSPSRLCYYAADPLTRPDCELTAAVRFGPLALCAGCAQRRSTVGKGQRAVWLPPVAPVSPLEGISVAQADLGAAQRRLAGAVGRARRLGCSWSAIAAQLGTTRQAAQQRFGPGRPHRQGGGSDGVDNT